MAKKRGPHLKAYRTSWNVEIKGLSKTADGRWRIAATGERFTEENERRAVQHFMDVMASVAPQPVKVEKPMPVPDFNKWAEHYKAIGDTDKAAEMAEFAKFQKESDFRGVETWDVPNNAFWA